VYETVQRGKSLLAAGVASHHNSEIMMPARLITETHDILDDQDIVALDNGLYKVRFARNYETHFPNTLLLDNALATMGAGYCSGLVAKMLNPDRKVVVFV